MEFYIKYSNSNQIRLPVPPPSFKVLRQNSTQTVTISQLGEVNLWGPELLKTITIQSFWPYRYMPTYCKYSNFIKPNEFIDWVNKAKNSKNPVRLVITDSKTGLDINMECLIEQFDTEVRGFNGDIDFTIGFREYRRINVVETPVAPPPKPDDSNNNNSNNNNGYEWYTIKKGDTLWGISKRKYGKGSKWSTIYNANKDKIKNPDVIIPGWKIKVQNKA